LWVKPFIVNNIRSKTDDELNKFKDTQYRDTLRAIIKDYVKLVKNNDSYDLKKGQDFLDEIQFILHRKQIDSTDIRKLTEFLNKEKLAYERSEKNGN
jgi:tRNA C32,U32 (ribose-2'-O)-methylase TrmJ